MPEWSTSLPDWQRRIVSGEPLIPFDPLFPSEADAGLAVLDALRIADMPGSPTFGSVSLPWVRAFAASVFGAYDPSSGRRLVREWFLLISKKNSKSTTAGMLMLAMLIRNWRPAGEFGILAPTVEVANNAFKPAADAIRADDELRALLHVQDHIRTITHRTTRATLQVVAADSETVAGKKWIVTLVDELWLFGRKANAEDMLREATGGLASRPEGCVIWLSTQANDPPAGVFAQKLRYARGVRDGEIEDREFCPVLYEFPPDMIKRESHLDPENFRLTNPNLNASVDRAYLEREFRKARTAGEESMRGFLAKHLNVEIGLSLQSNRWAGAEFWRRRVDASLTIDEVIDRCDLVTIGIDGGGLDDLLGLVVLGRDAESGRWLCWAHAWAHPSVLARRQSEAERFRDFADDGDLTIVDAVGDDVLQVAEICERVADAGVLDKVGVDAHGIGAVLDELTRVGIEESKVVAIPQGWKLQGAIKTTERKLAAGELAHNGSRMMDWCVGNARVEPRGNAVMITKQAAGFAKIDPLMALFDAAALMALHPQQQDLSQMLGDPIIA